MSPESEEFQSSPERRNHVIAVCPFIVTPDGFFATVKELTNKRQTIKLAGMRSCPMETLKPGETEQEALARTFREELVIPQFTRAGSIPLCRIQFSPGIWLHAYLFRAERNFDLKTGSEVTEVSNPEWTHIDAVLSSHPSERKFRPGVREIVKSFLLFREEREGFKPRVYFYCEDRVPEVVFDELEQVPI